LDRAGRRARETAASSFTTRPSMRRGSVRLSYSSASGAAAREIPEALEALAEKSGSPALNAPDGNAQARRDRTGTPAFGARQNDARPRGVPLCASRGSYPDGQCGRFLGRQLEGSWWPSASRRGLHLDELPYRNRSKMYSTFPPS
jgi:hypothetical protein